MKITVIGAGAMGSLYAGMMASSGHFVQIVDPWIAHVKQINDQGLLLEGASGRRVVKTIKAYSSLKEIQKSDIYIISTKYSYVEIVAKDLAKFLSGNELVITIQNGLGSGAKVAEHINTNQIIMGVAEGFGASIVKAGHVHHHSMKLIRLGEMKKSNSERVEDLVGFWESCGFDTKPYENIDQLIWEKFLCNVTFSGPCAVYGCNLGELIRNPEHWSVALGCMREAYEIGIHKGISFSFKDPKAYVLEFGNRMPDAKPSMLLDHQRKKRSEIDAINGMVHTLGRELKIDTPYNQVIASIVNNIEESQGFK